LPAVCKKPLSYLGLKYTFKESSKKRGDGKNKRYLKNLTSIVVHDLCRKNYINENLISASNRRRSDVPISPAPTSSLRSLVPSFNFKDYCFLCNVKIDEEYLLKQKKTKLCDREIVFSVQKLSMKDNVLEVAKKRKDEWGKTVKERIENIIDLVAVDARYHHSCLKAFYLQPTTSGQKRGYRPDSNVDEAMGLILSYLKDNANECQFSLDDLMNLIEGDYRPDVRNVKSRLLKEFGDDVLIVERANKPTIVCFRNTGYKILTDAWYAEKEINPAEERMRIVRTAATIILEDIRSQVYETKQYPASNNFFKDIDTMVPPTLKIFLEDVILKNKKGSLEKWIIKCTALSHSIISAVRPRSFISPLQLGVGAFLYKKFGSRYLLDILSALGFSSSYSESILFEISAVMRPGIFIDPSKSFSQFVFDNADFKTNTLDGLNTFHAMGGIHCVTPKSAIAPDQVIPRLTRVPSADVIGKYGSIPIHTFQRNKESSGLKDVKILDLESIHPVSSNVVPSSYDLLWLYGKWKEFPSIPGWYGFMEQITDGKPFQVSQVLCLPFINAPPGDYDTILTALLSASENCRSLNQQTCFVTFDQPLYLKARDIVSNSDQESPLNNVVVRLGGFHLLMSFMGSMGYIMDGSGLKELLSIIYAPKTVENIFTGHAYSRTIRSHILVHLALAQIILDTIEFTDDDRKTMELILNNIDRSIIFPIEKEDAYKAIVEKFKKALLILKIEGQRQNCG
jgi:hypothetical protein